MYQKKNLADQSEQGLPAMKNREKTFDLVQKYLVKMAAGRVMITWISLGILSDQLDGFGLRLSLDDYTFLFILGLFHQVLRSFSLLLRDLLGLNGVLEFLAERQIADGNIIDNDIELLSPLRKILSDFI